MNDSAGAVGRGTAFPVASEHLDPNMLAELRAAIQAEIADGLQGAQIAVAHNGQVVLADAFGDATVDTPIVLMSPSKTAFDSGLWLLIGDGAIELDQPVAKYLPEFASNGKEQVTVRQVMTNTGGFPTGALDWPEWSSREARLAAYSRFQLEYEPGTRYVYHPATGVWVMADVIHALTGQDHHDFLSERVFTPLGLTGIHGVSLGESVTEQQAVLAHTFDLLEETAAQVPPIFRGPDGELVVPGGLALPEGRAVGFPGAGCVATATGVARLYQAFLHDTNGLWDADVLRLATRETAIEMRGRWDKPIRRSLSMYQAGELSARPGSESEFFGSSVSPAAFGHDGLGGNFAWADPESGLSVAFLTNTIRFMPWELHGRASRLSTLAGRLLGREERR